MAAVPDNSPKRRRRSPGLISALLVVGLVVACLGSLPFTLAPISDAPQSPRRYEATNLEQALLPPSWAPHVQDERDRREAAIERGESTLHLMGTDRLGRDVFVRCLTGGGVSLGIGLAAAMIAVIIGTLWGTIAAWSGGRIDAAMMRAVDVFFGLPYVLLVVLLAVAVSGLLERFGGDLATGVRQLINVVTLLVAIGSVSWLTMARVIRGQVLSLKAQPFIESCLVIGVSRRRLFLRHLLPNLLGPIIVYGTLIAPAAILSESFLSFLGIGVAEPLPSWGNLAADGLNELNVVRSRWWLLLFPCVLIGFTLLAMNFLGEALRERFDPKRAM